MALPDSALQTHQCVRINNTRLWLVQAYRILDRGPPADAVPGAAAFRKLWGARSEMRRLPDASICEAVAWDTVPPSQRLALPDMIVKHILQLHFPGSEVLPQPDMLCAVLQGQGGGVRQHREHDEHRMKRIEKKRATIHPAV